MVSSANFLNIPLPPHRLRLAPTETKTLQMHPYSSAIHLLLHGTPPKPPLSPKVWEDKNSPFPSTCFNFTYSAEQNLRTDFRSNSGRLNPKPLTFLNFWKQFGHSFRLSWNGTDVSYDFVPTIVGPHPRVFARQTLSFCYFWTWKAIYSFILSPRNRNSGIWTTLLYDFVPTKSSSARLCSVNPEPLENLDLGNNLLIQSVSANCCSV